ETLPGGPASYLQEICSFQADRLGDGNLAFVLPASQASHVQEAVLSRSLLWERSGRNLSSFLNLAGAVRAGVRKYQPEIIHVHSTYAGVIARLAVLSLRQRPKVVYCSHGWSFAMETSAWKRHIYRHVEVFLSRFTDGIVNISGFEQRLALAAGIPAEKQRTILNGICEQFASPTAERTSAGPLLLLFVGRHDRQKGLDILLEAMENVPPGLVRLDVIGERQLGAGRTTCANRAPDEGQVRFLGWLDRMEVFRLMASVDAVVMPSRWEGFGLVAVEALRAGTPVIASNRGALPELVVDGKTGYVVEPTAYALASCIASLDRATLRTMGAAARLDFLERFTSARMNEELAQYYLDVAS
ncbi:MAG: glycosyltransferase family 1 protein, partial [Hyphomicrobiales bacterium]|nr:glycosyltransferase family 1 protein [Hyphomicrobiales bacterium]